MNYIITPAATKVENQISRSIKMKDIGYIAIVVFINLSFIGLGYAVFKISPAFWSILAVFILTCVILLIIGLRGRKKNSLGRKNYEQFVLKLKNFFKPHIIEFQKFKDIHGIREITNEGVIKRIQNGVVTYQKLIRITGRDLSLIKDEDVEGIILNHADGYKSLKQSIKLIYVDEKVNLEESIAHLEKQKSKVSDKHISEINKIQNLIRQSAKINDETLQKGYYILLNSPAIEGLNKNNYFLGTLQDGVNIRLSEVQDKNTIMRVFNNIYLGATNPAKLFSTSFKNFTDVEHSSNVEFYKDHYTQNGQVHTILNIYTYPTLNPVCWLKPLALNEQSTIVQDVVVINDVIARDIINAQKIKSSANAQFIVGAFDQATYEHAQEKISELIDAVVSSDLKLLLLNTVIILHADEYQELMRLREETINSMAGKNFQINTLEYQQRSAFESLMTFNNSAKNIFLFNEITNLSLAAALPYSSMMINDVSGVYMGVDETNNTPVFLDPRIRDADGKRTNSNIAMTGKSGTGKTYVESWMIYNWAATGQRVILFDALADFWGFMKTFEFKKVNISQGRESKINLLESFDPEATIQSHVSELIVRFAAVDPAIKQYESTLQKILTAFFNKLKLANKNGILDIGSIKTDEWPVMSDLDKTVRDNNFIKGIDNATDLEIKRIRDFIYLLSEGSYGELWNGQTKFNILKDDLIIIDTRTVNNLNEKVRDLQMYLVFKFIYAGLWKFSKENKGKDFIERKWTYIVADEAHRYINDKNPVAKENFDKFGREIRHFDGTLFTTTQLMGDFKEVGSTVYKNTTYRLMKHMDDTDFKEYSDMISDQGSITEQEKKELTRTMNKFGLLININNVCKTTVKLPNLKEVEGAWKNELKPNEN